MLDIKRREFIALVGGGGLLLTAKARRARAQQPAMPVVGFLNATSLDRWRPRVNAFRQGLQLSGYVEDQNVATQSMLSSLADTDFAATVAKFQTWISGALSTAHSLSDEAVGESLAPSLPPRAKRAAGRVASEASRVGEARKQKSAISNQKAPCNFLITDY